MKISGSSAAGRQQFHSMWNKGKFAQPVGGQSWETFADDAETERGVMVADFHVWVIAARHETEAQLMSAQSFQRSIAPMAQAAIEAAATPRDVPVVVVEFAQSTLDVMQLAQRLALFNAYYSRAVSDCSEAHLDFDAGALEVAALWKMFLEARDEKAE